MAAAVVATAAVMAKATAAASAATTANVHKRQHSTLAVGYNVLEYSIYLSACLSMIAGFCEGIHLWSLWTLVQYNGACHKV